MSTGRLEAFSDGVLAIIITVMVLELKPPDGSDFSALHASATSLLTYVLSFVYIGIYWNNHHHLFQICKSVDGSVLWANLHLLFWLSLYPFTTNWMDEQFGRASVVIYGVNLLLAAIAFTILQRRMMRMPASRERMLEVVRHRPQGQGLAAALPARHRPGLRRAVARPGPLRGGRPDVAGAGPPDRALPGVASRSSATAVD